MPKNESGKETYLQKYVKNWEFEPNFKGWLESSPDGDSTKAFCAYCKTILIAHKKTVQDHSLSKKHTQATKNQDTIAALPKIDTFTKLTLSQQRKEAELKIATYMAEHCHVNVFEVRWYLDTIANTQI